MSEEIKPGDCVQIPDGRIGRFRDKNDDKYRVRVKRITSNSNQFLLFNREELTKVVCPKGWMSPQGYNSYLKTTLEKMKIRKEKKG
ncbi:hypothetical protein [Methanobacterium sp.]|uniref:hypothetical protein n=1 Tax=Methanobacterium sp. TaxID=2164 RepID=UPI003C7370A5